MSLLNELIDSVYQIDDKLKIYRENNQVKQIDITKPGWQEILKK